MATKKITIKNAGGIRGEIMQITPQIAKDFLKTNKKNRSVVASRIQRLATAMRNGEWIVSQPLMFNCDGTMIDGQHRCHAVIESGVPVAMLILHGFDPEKTFAKLDDVASRTLSHWLSIQGEARPYVLAGVIRMHHADKGGRNPFGNAGSSHPLTGPMGIDLLKETPELRQSVTEGPGIINTYLSARLCAYLHFRFRQSDKTLADNFFIDIIQGDYQGEGDPIYLLRERMKSNKTAKEKLKQIDIAALTIKVWNAYIDDTRLKKLQWKSGGDRPESFPKIK